MLFRVSEVESYRQFRNDPDAELGTLLAWLRNEVPPSQAMLAGTAFHDVLEHADVGELSTAESQGFKFIIEVDTRLALAPIRELRQSKQFGGLTITGKLDVLDGLRVEDHKTTGRFDPDRYLTGYQWRYYLSIFGAQVFRWNVFEMREVEPRIHEGVYAVLGVENSVRSRTSYGGTAPDNVKAQAERWLKALRS